MKAITIRESFGDILKPKSEEELLKIDEIFNKKVAKYYSALNDLYIVVEANRVTDFTVVFELDLEYNLSMNDLLEGLKYYGIDADPSYIEIDGDFVTIYIPIKETEVNENIGGAGGAGYAVYGGGWGRSFGNPSMGGRFGGRGFGFGGSSNLSGGPNLMYTYEVKPLNQDLQPPATTQSDVEEVIHTGSKIKGHILNSDGKEIEGNILHIEEDEDNNIKWYIVLDDEGIKQKVDPTTAYLVKVDDFVDPFIEDMASEESEVQESFYPNL